MSEIKAKVWAKAPFEEEKGSTSFTSMKPTRPPAPTLPSSDKNGASIEKGAESSGMSRLRCNHCGLFLDFFVENRLK